VGAVRHRELIRVLSFVVVLDMAVGVVALAVRSGDRSERVTQYAGSTGIPLDTKNGSVLAGGNFDNRRASGSGGSATTQATGAPATSATAAPVAPPSSAVPPTTSGPATATPSTATRSTAAPTTATTRKRPETTATTRAAGRSTPTTGRPAGTTAPSVTTATGPNGAMVKNGTKMGDPAGDAFVDGTQAPIKEGRVDIVRSRAVYEPDRITFAVQVDQPSDPGEDERWASDSTFANWEVDTNGDGNADFEVQYYIDEGTYGGVVSKQGAAGPEIACEVETAGYGPEGYSVTVPASCLGEPASLQYRVTMFYDTNPKDENADVASDVAPNGGLSFPVSRGA
jgi:hypothetical protein